MDFWLSMWYDRDNRRSKQHYKIIYGQTKQQREPKGECRQQKAVCSFRRHWRKMDRQNRNEQEPMISNKIVDIIEEEIQNQNEIQSQNEIQNQQEVRNQQQNQTGKEPKKKVVVGMSGGVDSSVAAYLLKEQGYDVVGVTMQIWQEEDQITQEESGGCCGLSAVDDARRVAWELGIPYYVMNFKKEFKDHVIDYFIDEYVKGRTPNPCIACNRYVKWESLLKRSMDIGADYIATGHYAQIEKLPNGRYALKKSVTSAKDQTYALYNLTQDQLAHTLMPVGIYEKSQIRKLAEQIGIQVAKKPDSQEICFIPDHDYAKFIEENSDAKLTPGNFVDLEGNILGRHEGITHYTVGQRKGLGLSMGKPVFVVEIRPETNEVVIGDSQDVFCDHLTCSRLNWMAVDGLHGETMRVMAKIRYSHKGAPCTIREIGADQVEVQFDEPQRAITPGQAVVFYDGDYVAGGGVIE